MALLDRLNTAADETSCQFLSAVGQGLVGSAVWNFGGPYARAGALTLGGLSLLASNYLCPDQEVGRNPDANSQGDCWQVDGLGTLIQYILRPDGSIGNAIELTNAPNYKAVTKIFGYGPSTSTEGFDSVLRYRVVTGETEEYPYNDSTSENEIHFTLSPNDGSECIDSTDNPPPPPLPDHSYTWIDQSNNCTYNITPLGFADGSPDGNNPGIVYLIEAPETRANYGRMGGCNFPTTIYYTGGGGDGNGPRYYPAPDNRDDDPDGVPWWLPPLVAGASSAIITKILDALLPTGPVPEWPDTAYAIQGICETVADGDIQPILSTPVKGGVFAPTVINRLDALTILLQYHLSLKTPVCVPEKPALEGDWRTISFISDETSPYGKSRLRKRFRYRSVSGLGLGEVIDHWRDFTWQAGPVCVKHVGASWGAPQVWAATVDEGKRVILHAAGEAGIDATEVGRWEVGGSSNPRYGVSGTMRVRRKGGYYWITARDGSEGRPLVAQT